MREVHAVTTPENVEFDFELAALGSRGAAWLVDGLIMAVLIVTLTFIVSMASSVLGQLANVLMLVGVFVVQWWYGAILEWAWKGQTVGKRALGLRVIQRNGLRVTFAQAVIRNLVRVVDSLPVTYLVGGVCALVDTQNRRLGDLAADTLVVVERRRPAPSAIVPAAMRYNSFVADPHVQHAARRISPPERDMMVSLGLRRESLPLGVRHELFEKLAAHLERQLGVTRPSALSPEKYVLNLTAVVLGDR